MSIDIKTQTNPVTTTPDAAAYAVQDLKISLFIVSILANVTVFVAWLATSLA